MKSPTISLPLLVKLSVTWVSGASFFLAWRNGRRRDILASQQAEIRDALQNVGRPPVIFVVGFRGHGKSSFVNTVCRVLGEEDGPLVFRTETAPVGPTRTTKAARLVRAAGQGTVTLVDTPGLPAERLTRVQTETALGFGGVLPECVVVVLGCSYLLYSETRQVLMKRAMEISAVLRAKGLPFVVLLTHKEALKKKKAKEADELRKEVALRAKTDCVYFIENYSTTRGCSSSSSINIMGDQIGNRSVSVKNNFETHNVTLAVMRQCVEFVSTRRTDLLLQADQRAPISQS